MRNLKRVLSLVLAAMMLIGMMVIGASAAGSTKAADYSNAIEMLTEMGVVEGYPDGDYHQNDTVTRAQMAAIIYRVMTGDNKGNSDDAAATNYGNFAVSKFSDVAATNWAVGYIGYCANAGIIEGYPDGTFQPNKQITIYEVMAMLLRAVGYGKNNEYVGAEWTKYVLVDANQTNIYSGVVKAPDAAADRGVVAQLTYNAATGTDRVTYTPALGYVKLGSLNTASVGGTKLIQKNSEKVVDGDVWGNPATEYNYTFTIPGKNVKFSIDMDPVYTTTDAVDDCDIIEALGVKKSTTYDLWLNGTSKDDVTAYGGRTLNALNTTVAASSNYSATGRLTKVYKMGTNFYRIVEVDTYFGQVSKVTKEVLDKNGHVKTPASIDIDLYLDNNGKATTIAGVEETGYAVGDYVLVTKTTGSKAANVESVELATPVTTGKVSAYAVSGESRVLINGNVTIGGTKYAENVKFFYVSDNKSNNTPTRGATYEVYTDAYGNVIALVEPAPSAKTYAILHIGYDFSTGRTSKYDADVVDYDGDVSIWDINSYTNANTTPKTTEEDWGDRGTYEHHIVSYVENKDGTYDLVAMTAGTKLGENYILDTKDGSTASITRGNVNIVVGGKTVAVTDNSTTFVVENGKHQFTSYVGYRNMITLTNIIGLEVLVGSNGKADLVYVHGGETAAETTTELVYFSNAKMPATNANVVGITDGGTEWTQIDNLVIDGAFVSEKLKDGTDIPTAWGLYEMTIDAEGVVTGFKKVDWTVASAVISGHEGDSRVFTIGENGYVLADDAVILLVDPTNGTVAAGSAADLEEGYTVWFVQDATSKDITYIAIRCPGEIPAV